MCEFKLRPHHALCIQFFEGKGYSKDFTLHMSSIVDQINKECIVTITTDSDDICKKCPNIVDGVCLSQNKVCRYDNRVMELCGFKAYETVSGNEFLQRAKENIIDRGKLSDVCGDCQWKCRT